MLMIYQGGAPLWQGVLLAQQCLIKMGNEFQREMRLDDFEQSGDICRLFSWIKQNKKENSPAFPVKNEP